MKEFRITLADQATCDGCINTFGESEDCRLCAGDAHAKEQQQKWWAGNPHLLFMGVNIGQALSHAARGYVLGHIRNQAEVKDEDPTSRLTD